MDEQTSDPLVITVLGDVEPDSEQNNFSWTKKATKLFLEAYLERKDRFRNPEVKKRQLWTEIVQTLKDHGYTNLDEDTLDRKMRNMKRTYKTIKENNKRNITKRVSWEYYSTFQNIFPKDLDNLKSSENKNKLYGLNKRHEAEEKKIEIMNQIRETLEESNKIQQERNDLIRHLILSQLHSQDK